MTREQRRDIFEAIGLLAIVASLLFLALEVRQANLASKIAARDSVTQGHLEFMGSLIDSSVLPLAFHKIGTEQLTEYESGQLEIHNQRRWRHYERVYFMFQYGVLSDQEWEGFRAAIIDSMNSDDPFFRTSRESWEFTKRFLSSQFVTYVETQRTGDAATDTVAFPREPMISAPDAEDGSVSSTNAETEAITALLNEFYNLSVTEGSVDTLTDNHLRFFSEQPMILPPGRAPLNGREAVAQFYSGIFELGIDIVENSYADLTIVVQGDIATRRYVGTGVFRTGNQNESQTAVNRYLDVLTKEDGQWKTLVHSWVSVNP